MLQGHLLQLPGVTKSQHTWCCRLEVLGSTSATAAPARGTEKLCESPHLTASVQWFTSRVYVGLRMLHGYAPVRGSSASCTAARAPAAFFTASLGPCMTMGCCWHKHAPQITCHSVLLSKRGCSAHTPQHEHLP